VLIALSIISEWSLTQPFKIALSAGGISLLVSSPQTPSAVTPIFDWYLAMA
jgi:hypothetical protein